MDPKLLELFQSIAANPTDVVVGQFRGYMEDFVRVMLDEKKNWQPPVGSPLILMKDYTAQTGEYVYTDAQGVQWLYCNGAAVSQTTYPDLYAFYGANAFAADSGGNFTLPDCRGRSLFFCGTHTNADLGDSDGVSESSRQAKHAHTNGVTATPSLSADGASAGTPSGTISSVVTTSNVQPAYAGGGNNAVQSVGTGSPTFTGSAMGNHTHTISGSVSIGGTIGTGTSGDAPAHIFIGSLFVRF
jgi:microcystin-dependent protein